LIKRFNFYDVYGYFLPGSTFLILLLLPIVIIDGKLPPGELTTAVLAIGLAYIAGHILQALAVNTIPSTAKVGKARRFPSDILLDQDHIFSSALKEKIIKKIQEVYGLDASVADQRADAFFVCRSALIKGNSVSYGEQFQGLYSLMRGLTIAFLLGAVYNAGWGMTFLPDFRSMAWIGLCGGLSCALLSELLGSRSKPGVRRLAALISLGLVALALLSTGYLLGVARTTTKDFRSLIIPIALASSFMAVKCYKSYTYFTWEFAKAVYRDFLNYEKPRTAGSRTATSPVNAGPPEPPSK
jgi:hypothetical protein